VCIFDFDLMLVQLSKNRRVICVDLRNHGSSPHSDEMTFDAMSNDVVHLLDHLKIEKAVVLGHSLGGKVAMSTGLNHSDRVAGLIVADISPVNYMVAKEQKDWNSVRKVMQTVSETNPANFPGRKELEDALSDRIPDLAMRQFVVANAVYEESSSGKVWRWRMNVPVLMKNLDYFALWPYSDKSWSGPVLFVSGQRSGYVLPEYHETIKGFFPQAQFSVIPHAGHWLHADKPKEFIDACGSFLKSVE
jgi:pimeloyl-ACP methyl ester carboxylesterase